MIQEIISGLAVALLIWLLRVIIKRDNNLNETIKEMKEEMGEMNKETILARIDSKTVINVLIKISNGINYADLIDKEKNRLMQDVNFKYRD